MEIKTCECLGCEKGISMCFNRPCWGTVEDFEKIIDEGHSDKLMLDYWIGRGDREDIEGHPFFGNPFKEDVFILCGAIKGFEGKKAPFSLFKKGGCTFLTEENKCSIHHIKPIEGKYACCKSEDNKGRDLRLSLVRMWDTEKGKELIKR